MSRLCRICLLALALAISPLWAVQPAAQDAPQFFSSLEDIPLMPGLQELPDQALFFDKPEGRIIEARAAMGSLTPEQVLAYYRQALPQFGWGRIDETSFFREQEKLVLSFQSGRSGPLVKFMVNPMR